MAIKDKYEIKPFPSPYGVLFILINLDSDNRFVKKMTYGFPSPYGVSFILIRVNKAYYREMR